MMYKTIILLSCLLALTLSASVKEEGKEDQSIDVSSLTAEQLQQLSESLGSQSFDTSDSSSLSASASTGPVVSPIGLTGASSDASFMKRVTSLIQPMRENFVRRASTAFRRFVSFFSPQSTIMNSRSGRMIFDPELEKIIDQVVGAAFDYFVTYFSQ